jgi:TRAP-type C4-dicarboxylate transport system permease small subunit
MSPVILSEQGEDRPVSDNRLLPEEHIACTLFLAATLLAGAQIVLRSAFDIGIPWSTEAIVTMMIWSVYFGAGAVTARRRHVRMDLLAVSASARVGGALEVAAAACTLLYVAIVVVLSFRFFAFVYHSGELDPSTELPGWVLVIGFPLGLSVTLIRAALDSRSRVRHLQRFL